MEICRTAASLARYLDSVRIGGGSIAFVPTMGALHEGHISLIRLGKEKADRVLCSIFVNPTQFNNAEDLSKYPRTPEADIAMLEEALCDALFIPEAEEIYPGGRRFRPVLDLHGADQVMEGHFRPGHFDGMLMVVHRLLELTDPDFLVMGQKDFQQYSLVRMMLDQLGMRCTLVIGITLREPDGLAMSSRNRRLDPAHRHKASVIYRALCYAREHLDKLSIVEIERNAAAMIDAEGFRTEYFSLVDGATLAGIPSAEEVQEIVACTACWAGDVRLIDNLPLRP